MTFPISTDSVWIKDRGNGEWVVGSGDFELAYVPENVARLFSAAPQLLAALKDLTDMCEDDDRFPLHTESARAAIIKATGGTV